MVKDSEGSGAWWRGSLCREMTLNSSLLTILSSPLITWSLSLSLSIPSYICICLYVADLQWSPYCLLMDASGLPFNIRNTMITRCFIRLIWILWWFIGRAFHWLELYVQLLFEYEKVHCLDFFVEICMVTKTWVLIFLFYFCICMYAMHLIKLYIGSLLPNMYLEGKKLLKFWRPGEDGWN